MCAIHDQRDCPHEGNDIDLLGDCTAICNLQPPPASLPSHMYANGRLSIVSLRHSVCRLGVCRCITKSIADHHNQIVVASMGESYITFDIDPIRNGLDLMAVTKWRFKG